MKLETVVVTRHGPVTLMRLDRPEALNALDRQVRADLSAAFAAYEADPDQRCAVVTGDAKAFAAGGDIKQMAPEDFATVYAENALAPFDRIAGARKPWIAAVAGWALGGGCELAMMADFIIAADTARFGQPEIRVGICPGMGGTQRLVRAVGKAKAMELVLTGRHMDATEAERAGLVARVVPAAELIDDALRSAAAIAAMAPLAVIANKELVNAAFETTLHQGLVVERRLYAALCSTKDKAEGMRAFVEKRKPVWSGR